MALSLSFSQLKLFESCPKNYHYRYVLKQEEKNVERKWSDFGSAMHEVFEMCYGNESLKNPAMMLNVARQMWDKYKLEGRMDWEVFKKCCINGMKLDLDIKQLEEKIQLDVGGYAFVGYLDVVTKDDEIIDWKSGTYTKAKGDDYSKQLKCYSYLYWRKHNIFPKAAKLYFPKNDKWHETSFTKDDILEVETWIKDCGDKITQMIEDEKTIWKKNTTKCFFCGYKSACLYQPDPRTAPQSVLDGADGNLHYNIDIKGHMCYLTGDVTPLLNKGLIDELSYDLKDKYWIQQAAQKRLGGVRPKNYDEIGTKRLFNVTHGAFRIGHLETVKKIVNDYAEYMALDCKLIINDTRLGIRLPWKTVEKLQGGKDLRDYQEAAVESLLENKAGFIEVGTGGGKTLITAEIIRRCATKTLWICDRKELITQTRKEFESELGLTCGEISNGKTEGLNKPLVIATIQTLSKKLDELRGYLANVNLAIVDEAHHASADTYVKTFKYITNAEYRLGTCLDPITMINTPSGKQKLEDLNVGDLVLSFNHNIRQVEAKPILNKWDAYKQKYVIRIETPKGIRKITCSPDHHVFTTNGYKKAKDLNTGDTVISLGETKCQ